MVILHVCMNSIKTQTLTYVNTNITLSYIDTIKTEYEIIVTYY